MHELISVSRRPKLTCGNIATFIQERLHTPITRELYDEFVKNGTNQVLLEILGNIPEEHRPPILHTLVTHVTKEKAVFIYGIGGRYVDDKDKVRFIAAGTDLLWCLSLIVDDIIDADTQRAGRETSWLVFGKEASYGSAKIAFETMQRLTEDRLSTEAKRLLVSCVDESMRSLEDPAVRTLDSGREAILTNIDCRARFHCEYPIRALFPDADRGLEVEEVVRLGVEGLLCVNRAGQILNDVKDLVPSRVYGRGTLSDISGGTSTIPLIMLYEKLDVGEREEVRRVFGRPAAIMDRSDWLTRVFMEKLPRREIYSLVSENYKKFLEMINPITNPGHFTFCVKWVDYKLDQSLMLLAGCQV